ncbi:MAG: PEP-CTERM sorting domain-containing protein [Planctomycetota bacterium]|jgi:hypothetical protein
MKKLALLLVVGVLAGGAAADTILPQETHPGSVSYSATGTTPSQWVDWTSYYNGGAYGGILVPIGTPLPVGDAAQGGVIRDLDITWDLDIDWTADPTGHMTTWKGPAYNDFYGAFSGTWTVSAGKTVKSEAWRAGHKGGMGIINLEAGATIDITYQTNMPRYDSSAAVMTMNLGPGATFESGQFFLRGATPAKIIMDPTAVVREVGYAGGAAEITHLQAYIDAGQIIGTGGETPYIVTLYGQGYDYLNAYEIRVPEPISLSLLSIGGLALLRRRR